MSELVIKDARLPVLLDRCVHVTRQLLFRSHEWYRMCGIPFWTTILLPPNVWNSFLEHYSIATDEQKHQTRVSGHLVTGSFGHRVIWSPG